MRKTSLLLAVVLGFSIVTIPQTQAKPPVNLPVEVERTQAPSVPRAPLLKIKTYKCIVEISDSSATSGSLNFDVTCEFESSREMKTMEWGIAGTEFPATKAQIDGKDIEVKTEKEIFTITSALPIKPGEHKLRLVYGGQVTYSQPQNVRTQMFCNGYHFHCYNAWFPVNYGAEYERLVKFTIDITIPPNFFLLSNDVPKEYRDKPKPDGKYHIETMRDNVYTMKLFGGDYRVYKDGNNDFSIRVYTFKKDKADFAPSIAKKGRDSADFYGQYFGKACDEDYFIAAQTGRRGNSQLLDGGYCMDSTILGADSFSAETLAHECAHLSWFAGSGIVGDGTEPDTRVLSESFAEFSAILYMDHLGKDKGSKKWRQNLETYMNNRNSYERPLTDPGCTSSDIVVYQKGSLVLWALKNYVGDEAFQKGMRLFFEKFAPKKGQPKKYARLTDFKEAIEESFGGTIDPFWTAYFANAYMIWVDYKIQRTTTGGKTFDMLVLANKGNPNFQTHFKVFFYDGTSKEYTLAKESEQFVLDAPAAGVEFLDYWSTIPRLTDKPHTMCYATIAACLAWRKPIIILNGTDSEFATRAEKWQGKTGGQIADRAPEESDVPLIFVGPVAIGSTFGEALKNQPIIVEDDKVRWFAKEIFGEFESTMMITDERYPLSPIILDLCQGELPEDLAWSGILRQKEGMVNISYNYTYPGAGIPPKADDLLGITWLTKKVGLEDCRLDVPITVKRNYDATYNGLSLDDLSIGEKTMKLRPDDTSLRLVLNYTNGVSKFKAVCHDRFLSEEWNIDFVPSSKGEFAGPEKLIIPDTTSQNYIDVKWSGGAWYLYSVDGKVNGTWFKGNSLSITGLPKGWHDFKVVFISEQGILSPVFEKKVLVGVSPPKLIIDRRRGVWKRGQIVVTGKTDPGAKLNPPGQVNPDGTFKIEYKSEEVPGEFMVSAENEFGQKTEAKVPIFKYAYIRMRLGDKTAFDDAGASVMMDVPPQIIGGTTYVPMRFIGQQLGAIIDWDGSSKKITYNLLQTKVELWIGKTDALINGRPYKMASPPQIISGKTMVPVRFIGEALGAAVTWDAKSKTVTVEYPG